MSVQENIKRGTVEMLLLALLTEQDMYGYQLCQELAERSKEQFILQEGSMYPILYRLTEKGLVSTRKELVGKRRTRVYYHIEPEGVTYMKENAKEYFSIHQGIVEILKTVGENYDSKQ
ncbi:MAG: helix-turn-helix transcriptional regulator [Clostridiales bacterium]|nr:helix-turn-helix transcriptional regulator [Clostridiales bacterium]